MSSGESLYFYYGTRAMRPQWLANELGIKLNLKWVDLGARDQKKSDYLAINPAGTVPFFVDGDVKMMESMAIVQYLAAKYREKKDFFIPTSATPEEKGAYYQALVYPIANLDETIIEAFVHTFVLPAEMRNADIPIAAKKKWDELHSKVVLNLIKHKQFVAGDKFTIADICLGYIVHAAAALKWLEAFPAIGAYVKRLGEREAFKITYDRKNPAYPAPN